MAKHSETPGGSLAALTAAKLDRTLAPVHPQLQPTSAEGTGEERANITVSLYPPDLARLKSIRRILEDSGIRRASDSDATRIAIRLATMDPTALLAAYRAMQMDDKRKRTTAGKAL
jgi:hypothetical protein